LATMSQQIGITMGTPVMSAIATGAMTTTTLTGILGGIHTAIAVNTALVLITALTTTLFLRTPTTTDK
ncbi:MFS transporter, partial [Streptomyces sp. NPDC000963]